MPKSVKREMILIKIETVQGTDAIPTPALDAILVEDIGWSYAGARMVERNPVKGTLGKFQSIFAGTLMEMSFKAEIKGSGVLGTPPEIGPALRACGIGETIVPVTSVAYSPVSSDHESVTIYYFEDGARYDILGCMGNPSINLPVGEVGMVDFTFTGHVVGPTDVAIPAGTFDAVDPAAILGGSFSALGFSAVIKSLSLDLGNEISTPEDFNAADGYSNVFIADRDPAGSFDPEAPLLLATKDFHDEWKTGANGSIETGTIGPATERYALTMPTSYIREIGPADRDGLRAYDIGYGTTGDDAAFELFFD
jgi:hypothetical protein